MLDTMGDATAVALVGLLSGLMLGLAARLGRFCTLGAIEDYFYSSSDLRLRMWGIAIGTAVIGGMTTATLLAIFLVPLFFVTILRLFGRDKPAGPAAGTEAMA